VAAFGLLQVGLQLGIETRWRVVRDPVHFTRLAHLQGHASGQMPTVLFLGTSRFEWGVRASRLREQLSAQLGLPVAVANWGTGGWGYFRALLSWERLERDGIRPDLVLIEVLPALLNDRYPLSETDDLHLPTCELDSADVELVLAHDAGRSWLREEQACAALVPVHSQRFHLLRLGCPRLLPPEMRYRLDVTADFRCTVPARRRRAALESARQGYEDRLHDFSIGGPGCRAVEELLGRLRRLGVKVVLLLMPEGPTFRSWYPSSTAQQIETYLAGLEREHGVRVLDLREWMDDESAFNDSHHLTVEGGDRFSERLGREVIAPMLRSQRVAATR
jgi:hypothetical protein